METVFEVAHCPTSIGDYEGHTTMKVFRSLDGAIQYCEDYINKHDPEWANTYRDLEGDDDDDFTMFAYDYCKSPSPYYDDKEAYFAWTRRYWTEHFELCIREVEFV